MKAVIAVVALAICASAWDLEAPHAMTFDDYLVEFGKSYSDETSYFTHMRIFERSRDEVVAHNADTSQTWKKGINQFSDMTETERSQFFGLNRHIINKNLMLNHEDFHYDLNTLPDSVDWRTKNVVSPVKNQGGCGSCWAFAATETIESNVAMNTGKAPPLLSTQNMVSCTPNPQHCGGTGGCDGATAELGMEYVKQKGIASEADYPYTARTGSCNEGKKKTASISGWVKLIENNYTDLVVAIASVGPIAVSVAADPWMSYSSGVFTGCRFAPSNVVIDHGVQLVGYGTDAGSKRDFWIVRNSWGAGWGERGYIRLEKHSDGDMKKWCAPDNRPQDGTGCDGGPPSVTVCGSCGIWYDSAYAVGGKLL